MSWLEKYSINNFLLDAQHKKLIAIINRLYSSMKEGKAKNILEITLDNLITYTQDHFNTEERMMLKANYSGYKEHKFKHENLTKKVIEFQKSFLRNHSLESMDLIVFLKNWLINHIEGTDKKYKDKIS